MTEEEIAECANCGHGVIRQAREWLHISKGELQGPKFDPEKHGKVTPECLVTGCNCKIPTID